MVEMRKTGQKKSLSTVSKPHRLRSSVFRDKNQTLICDCTWSIRYIRTKLCLSLSHREPVSKLWFGLSRSFATRRNTVIVDRVFYHGWGGGWYHVDVRNSGSAFNLTYCTHSNHELQRQQPPHFRPKLFHPCQASAHLVNPHSSSKIHTPINFW